MPENPAHVFMSWRRNKQLFDVDCPCGVRKLQR